MTSQDEIDPKLLCELLTCSSWDYHAALAAHSDYPSSIRRFSEWRIAHFPIFGAVVYPDGEIPRDLVKERYDFRLGRWFAKKNQNTILKFRAKNPELQRAAKAGLKSKEIQQLEELRNSLSHLSSSITLALGMFGTHEPFLTDL